jgi:hypothetical protein
MMRQGAVLALLLLWAPSATGGVMTCNDQVEEARAALADRLDRPGRDKLDAARRLCAENKRAEALDLLRQLRAALAPPPQR